MPIMRLRLADLAPAEQDPRQTGERAHVADGALAIPRAIIAPPPQHFNAILSLQRFY